MQYLKLYKIRFDTSGVLYRNHIFSMRGKVKLRRNEGQQSLRLSRGILRKVEPKEIVAQRDRSKIFQIGFGTIFLVVYIEIITYGITSVGWLSMLVHYGVTMKFRELFGFLIHAKLSVCMCGLPPRSITRYTWPQSDFIKRRTCRTEVFHLSIFHVSHVLAGALCLERGQNCLWLDIITFQLSNQPKAST